MTKLLLVEDEEHIYTGLIFNLELEGYEIVHAKDGGIAKEILFDKEEKFDLIILDIMIPVINGYDLCYALRKNKNYTPVLMLTAKSFDKDKIRGLQSGADDYITKPFNLEELLTRIQVILRRQHWINQSVESNVLKFGNVYIDFEKFIALVNDSEVKLTSLEFKLMKLFNDNEGKVLSREDIFEKVWDVKDYLGMRSVDNFVARLRKYFESDPSNPRYFQSVRGVGYKFVK